MTIGFQLPHLLGEPLLLEGAPGLGKTLLVRTLAEALHLEFARILGLSGVPTQTGVFGAMMDVSLTNQGPATFVLRIPPGGTRVE